MFYSLSDSFNDCIDNISAWLEGSAMASTPFLSVDRGDKGMCSLCNEHIKDNEVLSNLTEDGLHSFHALANRWVRIDEFMFPASLY